MKRPRLYGIILVLLCVSCCCFFVYSLFNYRDQIFALRNSMVDCSVMQEEFIALIEEQNQLKSHSINDLEIEKLGFEEELHLHELMRDSLKEYAIIRLAHTSCGSCNEKQINLLNGLQDKETLIVLSNIASARKLRLFMSNVNVDIPIYQMKHNQCLFHGDNTDKLLVLYVDSMGSILRTYYISERMFGLLPRILSQYID
jgi:cell division protein FtsL